MKPRHSSVRFSLRTLLGLVALVSVVLGVVNVTVKQAWELGTVINSLESSGIRVAMDRDDPSPFIIRLRRWTGLPFRHNAVSVSISQGTLSQLDIDHLKKLAPQGINFHDCSLDDSCVTLIHNMQDIHWITFHKCSNVSAVLEALPTDIKIAYSSFYGSDFTEDDIRYLDKCTCLTKLGVSATPMSDEGLRRLQEFRNLKWLNLSGTRVTTTGIREYKREMPDCEVIKSHLPGEPYW